MLKGVKETLIQYILCNVSREDFFYRRDAVGDKVTKTLAPKIYEIFYCKDEEGAGIELGIIMEALHDDVHNLTGSEYFVQPGHGVTNSFKFLADISADLYYAQRLFGFSHRDLKLDNIMFKEKTSGQIRNLYYLIDFGFSCLKFDGGLPCEPDSPGGCNDQWNDPIEINCIGLNEFEHSICNMPDRDLTQLSFNIWDNYQYTFPPQIIEFCSSAISEVLIMGIETGKITGPASSAKRRTASINTRFGQHNSKLYESLQAGIPKSELSAVGFSGWGLLYIFLNQPNTLIDNPRCNPINFSMAIQAFETHPGRIYKKYLKSLSEEPVSVNLNGGVRSFKSRKKYKKNKINKNSKNRKIKIEK